MIESKVVRARGKRAGDAGGRNDKRAKVLAGGGYVFITGTVVHIYLMGTYKGQNWSNCTLSIHVIYYTRGFPGGSVVKNPPANAEDTGDMSSIPGSGRSPGGENGNPLHYSCLEKSHGQRSLADYSPRGCKESDTTEQALDGYIINLSVQAQLCPTLLSPWTVACQAPLSMGSFKQEHRSGLPFPPPGDLPDPEIELTSHVSSALVDEPPGKPIHPSHHNIFLF